MFRSFIIAAASAAVLMFSATAFAQKPDHGTADEAKAMLMKAVAALKADKQKTLDLINEVMAAASSIAISMCSAPTPATARPLPSATLMQGN